MFPLSLQPTFWSRLVGWTVPGGRAVKGMALRGLLGLSTLLLVW